MPVAVIDAYITYLVSADTKTLETTGGKAFHCRGAAAPSVSKFVWALHYFEASLDLFSNVSSPKIVQRVKQLRKAHSPKGSPPFDVHKALPEIWKAINSNEYGGVEGDDGEVLEEPRMNPFGTGLWRARTWTMLLIQLCLIGRVSEVTEFCPLVESIRLPRAEDAADWCPDGQPLWMAMTLVRWKTSKDKPVVRGQPARSARPTLTGLTPARLLACSAL